MLAVYRLWTRKANEYKSGVGWGWGVLKVDKIYVANLSSFKTKACHEQMFLSIGYI